MLRPSRNDINGPGEIAMAKSPVPIIITRAHIEAVKSGLQRSTFLLPDCFCFEKTYELEIVRVIGDVESP